MVMVLRQEEKQKAAGGYFFSYPGSKDDDNAKIQELDEKEISTALLSSPSVLSAW